MPNLKPVPAPVIEAGLKYVGNLVGQVHPSTEKNPDTLPNPAFFQSLYALGREFYVLSRTPARAPSASPSRPKPAGGSSSSHRRSWRKGPGRNRQDRNTDRSSCSPQRR